MIEIIKSSKTDCTPVDGNVDPIKLMTATTIHQDAVFDGMTFIAQKLQDAGEMHDYTKLMYFNDFKEALESGKIKESAWYAKHIIEERHHLLAYAPSNVTFIDIIEYMVDCIMAGSARSAILTDITISDKMLQRAFANTVEMIKKEVVVKEEK